MTTNDTTEKKEHELVQEGVVLGHPLTSGFVGTEAKPRYEIKFQIMKGPDAGRFVWWNASVDTDKSLLYVEKTLKTLGWDPEKVSMEDFKPTKDANLVIAHRVWPAKPATPNTPFMPAKTVAEVKYVNSLDGSDAAPSKAALSAAASKAVGAGVMARLKAAKAATNGAVEPASFGAPNGAAPSGSDDEIPF